MEHHSDFQLIHFDFPAHHFTILVHSHCSWGGGHFSLQCEALLSSKIIVEHLTANKTDIYIDRFETRKGVKGEYRTGQVVGLDTTPNE